MIHLAPPCELNAFSVGLYIGGELLLLKSYGCHLTSFRIAERAQAGAYSMMSVLCDKAIVKKEELYEIVGNDKYQINNLLDKKYEPRDICDILRDAHSLLGRELPYCVFSGNCEHFVTELRYGKPHSRQVQIDLYYDNIACSYQR